MARKIKDLDFGKLTRDDAETWGERYRAYESMLKTRKLEHELSYAESSDYRHHVLTIRSVGDGSAANHIDYLNGWRRSDPGCDITININSPGGLVFAGFALYDTIQELVAEGHRITTCAYGYAASMGGVLLQAGVERQMSPNAYLMMHEVSSGVIGKVSELTDEAELAARLNARALDILAERSTLSVRQVKNRTERRDWWLDADESLKFGFIDSVASYEVAE